MVSKMTCITTSVAAKKERLARLLASENIYVEHKNIPTAYFNLKARVLALPLWEDMPEALYDLLTMHEVGHALWTPLQGWHDAVVIDSPGSGFKSYLNVLEDARIEKKIQRKFPGGRKAFRKGYENLLARDFFGLSKLPSVDALPLIDRINLKTKGRDLMDIPFTAAEAIMLKRAMDTETFDQVEALARELYEAEKVESGTDVRPPEPGDTGDGEEGEGFGEDEEGEETGESWGNIEDFEDEADDSDDSSPDADTDGDDSDGSDSEDGDSEDDASDSEDDDSEDGDSDGDSTEEDTDEGDSDDDTGTTGDEGGESGEPITEAKEPRAATDDAFHEKEKELVTDEDDNNSPAYISLPKDSAFNLDDIILDWKTISEGIRNYNDSDEHAADIAANAADLVQFRRDNLKVVNYLVKEFEMKKAAAASHRAATSKTGVIDTNKLNSYKWSDDVFKKLTTTPDGKSHGLHMVIDWSGSMADQMKGTIEQVLNLVEFCRKVQIPYDVYAFSDHARNQLARDNSNADGDWVAPKEALDHKKLETGDLTLGSREDSFTMLHLISSKMKARDYNAACINMMIFRGAFSYYSRNSVTNRCSIPGWLGLGGTPLSESILVSAPIINRFRAENNLDIVNAVWLTDGCGRRMRTSWDRDTNDHESFGYDQEVIFRDKKTHKEYQGNQDMILLDLLRARTGCKVVNFFVTSDHANSFKRHYNGLTNWQGDAKVAWSTAKAEGGLLLTNSSEGWDHHYLLVGGSALEVDSDSERLSDDLIGESKAKLRRAFGNAAGRRLKNRALLREFIGLIAV
jgi:hypothetical protein